MVSKVIFLDFMTFLMDINFLCTTITPRDTKEDFLQTYVTVKSIKKNFKM